MLFRGGAGTGKSFTLKEVARGIAAAGREVVVLAPQRQQFQDLQADGMPAQTLSLFLFGQKVSRGTVVILDEAGQVGAKQLALLIRAVKGKSGPFDPVGRHPPARRGGGVGRAACHRKEDGVRPG